MNSSAIKLRGGSGRMSSTVIGTDENGDLVWLSIFLILLILTSRMALRQIGVFRPLRTDFTSKIIAGKYSKSYKLS